MNQLSPSAAAVLRHQARILMLLDAAGKAGLTPIGIIPFHTFAFLSNVLAPVWDMHALDGSVLKRQGGPFYPSLQRDLDRLVGLGMVLVTGVTHIRDPTGRWRLEGQYCLNYQISAPAVDYLLEVADEARFASFARELAYALSALGDTELAGAFSEDATYSDPAVSDNNVLDFEEWSKRNPSANAAHYFDHFMPSGTRATSGEKLHLYVRHLRRRINAG